MLARFLNIIILLGAVQGIIVSSLLFFSAKNRHPNRILAGIILLIALASINLYGSYINWFNFGLLRFIVQCLPLVMPMAFGPLIYFYVQASLNPGFTITGKQKRHFIPLAIDLVPPLIPYLFLFGIVARLWTNNPLPWANFIDTYNVYADIPRWVSVTLYIWLSVKYFSAYQAKCQGQLNGQSRNFAWLRQLLRVFMVFQCIWLLYLIPYVIPRYTNQMLAMFDWYPIYIPMAFMIYWLGIKGYLVSAQTTPEKKTITTPILLSQQQVEAGIASIIKAMEIDHLYLDKSLNLSLLSRHISLPAKTVSILLNQHVQKSFTELVNGYRVEAFKQKILEPGMDALTIAAVAAESGFASQATFQRVFKEITGSAPSEFRKSVTIAG